MSFPLDKQRQFLLLDVTPELVKQAQTVRVDMQVLLRKDRFRFDFFLATFIEIALLVAGQ